MGRALILNDAAPVRGSDLEHAIPHASDLESAIPHSSDLEHAIPHSSDLESAIPHASRDSPRNGTAKSGTPSLL